MNTEGVLEMGPEKTGSSQDQRSIRKIQERMAMMKSDAGLAMSLSKHIGPRPPDFKLKREGHKIITDIPDDQLFVILQRLKDKYAENLARLYETDLDENGRYAGLMDNFGYYNWFEVGSKEELFDALLEFAQKERERDGSRFYHNTSDLMHYFADYKFFPKDARFRIVARDYIANLLSPRSKKEYQERRKKLALEYVDRFIKEGVLNEKDDEDLIEKVTEE